LNTDDSSTEFRVTMKFMMDFYEGNVRLIKFYFLIKFEREHELEKRHLEFIETPPTVENSSLKNLEVGQRKIHKGKFIKNSKTLVPSYIKFLLCTSTKI
jgi:hypothetical protein